MDENACSGIANILIESNGSVGIVKKTRKLYMIDQTRVHIDDVEGLGNFLELEVCNIINYNIIINKQYYVSIIILGNFK